MRCRFLLTANLRHTRWTNLTAAHDGQLLSSLQPSVVSRRESATPASRERAFREIPEERKVERCCCVGVRPTPLLCWVCESSRFVRPQLFLWSCEIMPPRSENAIGASDALSPSSTPRVEATKEAKLNLSELRARIPKE